MKNKKAFTLIELLVVVLIIGILAAIALPQYEKAVAKSRVSQALIMLQSIIKAQDEYHLINGYYTNNLDELSISVPEGRQLGKMSDDERAKNYGFDCKGAPARAYCAGYIGNGNYPYIEFTAQQDSAKGKRWCVALGKNKKARKICETMGTIDNTMSGSSHDYYLIN